MRADHGSEWEGCPRTQLSRIVDAYAEAGLGVRVGFEAELMLFEPAPDGGYRPADSDGMFTLNGLDRHYELWRRVIDSLHAMGVAVPGEMDGRVLSEAFADSSPLARPVVYSQANVYKNGGSEPDLSDEEMEEVQEKLRGWGYAG
jgi:hypothetical protein